MIYYEKRGLKTLQKFKEVHIFFAFSSGLFVLFLISLKGQVVDPIMTTIMTTATRVQLETQLSKGVGLPSIKVYNN